MTYYAVSEKTLNGIIEYLVGQPWGQVNHLIVALQDARPIPPDDDSEKIGRKQKVLEGSDGKASTQ